jgi:hypothetical protein
MFVSPLNSAHDPVFENTRSSSSADKEFESLKPQDMSQICTKPIDHDDYPDGGLRAWLIVLGVRIELNYFHSKQLNHL